jgi:6-phosphogluconolactonase
MAFDVPTARLPGSTFVAPTVDEVIDRLASDLCMAAHRRYLDTGTFHLALSGGSTPQALYRRMMIDPSYRLMPWKATHLWLVDDRCVPFTDERSNWKMIKELIVDHSDIPADHVHPMPVLERTGDQKYERDLKSWLQTPQAGGRLDFVLLGMGNDGHTASLFPHTPALHEHDRWVVFNDGEHVVAPRPRMTMTYPLINNARRVVLLITGQAKYPMLQRVATSARDIDHLPITGVVPAHDQGEMTWYLDQAAITLPKPGA